MLTCFFDSCSIIYHEYALEGQTINKENYLQILCCLCDAAQRKRPGMWTGKKDNAPAPSIPCNQRFFDQKLVQQPPYSPYLALCDFWLFSKLKTMLKEMRFQSLENVLEKMMAKLKSIPEDEFKRCFQKWQRR